MRYSDLGPAEDRRWLECTRDIAVDDTAKPYLCWARLYFRPMLRSRLVVLLAVSVLSACAARAPRAPVPYAPQPRPPFPLPTPESLLSRIGYSIQAGAFSNPDLAERLRSALDAKDLEAFTFVDEDGLHKVRFGDFGAKELASESAEGLVQQGLIDRYYVVPPIFFDYGPGGRGLRERVVRTALGFMGKPYRWGGPSPETGFDCSGLTMAAYRLHGLALPRTAEKQFSVGRSVGARDLRDGDLVFFATSGGRAPSHVGLYLGQGRFIHAPGRGKVVRVDSLSERYYEQRFLGARSYVE